MAPLAFSFSKKAEPKRVVEALSTKEDDGRQTIVALEGGQVSLEKEEAAARALVIPCKNLLEEAARVKRERARPADSRPPPKGLVEDELEGGLIKARVHLSADDAEAMRELLKEGGDDAVAGLAAAPAPAPILMRDGSKRARGAKAPDATKDMYDNVSVETFGEALLRGMGYDPEKHTTKPVYRDKLRDTHLGLGAKALLPSERAPPPAKRGAPVVGKARGGPGKKEEAPAAGAPVAAGSAPAAAPPACQPGPAAEAGSATGSGDVAGEKRRKLEHGGNGDSGMWASRGLLVRVVGKGEELRDFYGLEAVVLEVDAASHVCRIKARVNGVSRVQQGVSLADLETRVSRECDSVRVVRGPRKGTVLRLVERDSKRGVAVCRLSGTKETEELPLDDVCQFVA